MKGLRELSLILVLIICLSTVTIANAPLPGPVVYIYPEETSANPGDSFTVDVNIKDVGDLYAYGVKIAVDFNLLSVASVMEGPFLQDQPGGPVFFYKIMEDYIDVECSSLGAIPGVSGSGKLFNVTFNVTDAGTSVLDMFDSVLIDSTITAIGHEVEDGYFSTPQEAYLVRRSAWPEHRHFVISKDEDFNGTHANQTLFALVKNLSPAGWDLQVYVEFYIVEMAGIPITLVTDVVVVAPGEIVELSTNYNFDLGGGGQYHVTAKCYYSYTGAHRAQGAKVKTFSFSVVL